MNWQGAAGWEGHFKHIVHFDKIPLYHRVNLINGFDSISINTPAEVIAYET